MKWFIAYFVTFLIFRGFFNSILPASIRTSSLYTLFIISSPIIFALILGYTFNFLEQKGVIKPATPKSPSDSSPAKDASKIAAIDVPSSDAVATAASVPSSPNPPLPTVESLLDEIDHMDGRRFERLCSRILLRLDFSDIQLTKASGDQGVDIVATKDGVRYAFQCKCYSSDLGNHPIQEVHAGQSIYKCQVGVVMTNRFFTPGAQELADATGVLLWDRNKLKSILQRFLDEEYNHS